MEIKKETKNLITNIIIINIVISIVLVIIIQINQERQKVQIATQKSEEETNQEIEVAYKKEIESKVTSRHTVIANRKMEEPEKIKQIVVEVEPEIERVPKVQYAKIEEITISRDMDLTIRTGISKQDFKKLISNVKQDTAKFFYDNSEYIYDLCEEYQINEIFFCGLISAESGWNIASNHRRTHNYISLMTKNGLIKYNSVEEGLIAAAKALHNNYLTEGGRFYHGKTLYGVKTKFCPASSTWVELVYGRMQQIMNSK